MLRCHVTNSPKPVNASDPVTIFAFGIWNSKKYL